MARKKKQKKPVKKAVTPKAHSLPQQKVDKVHALYKEGAYEQAALECSKIEAKGKRDSRIFMLHALSVERLGDMDKAYELARKSIALKNSSEMLKLLIRCHRARGETEKAIAAADEALALQPGDLVARILKIGAMEEGGLFDEAWEQMASLNNDAMASNVKLPPVAIYEHTKLLGHKKHYSEAMEQLDGLIEDPKTPPHLVRSSMYLKAKTCDKMKEYDTAFETIQGINNVPMDYQEHLEKYLKNMDLLLQSWTADHLHHYPISSCQSEMPVFIASMPRSGSSLLDQIIDAHPEAAGVGELTSIDLFAKEFGKAYDPSLQPPACFGAYQSKLWTRTAEAYIKEITALAPPEARRVVNKSLSNYHLVGIMARMFPRCRIINLMRDPRDVAISCFMGNFHTNMFWTVDIQGVADVWESSRKCMEHWKQVLDIPILDVHYEQLIMDPENQMRRVLEFIGLEWDESCTRFHETRRTVRTLSYDQVNRPIYTSSVGRNANYAKHIKDIRWPEYDPGAS